MKHNLSGGENILLDNIISDQLLRKNICSRDLYWFMAVYFQRYIYYPVAPFQKEILSLLQNKISDILAISAFRESGKSTLCSFIFPLWSIIGEQQKKCVVIICQNQEKAELVLTNIKRFLENDPLLIKDFGPFYTKITSEWNATSIVIEKYNARIIVASIGGSVRGYRHEEYRPQVFIGDDLDDQLSAENPDVRERLNRFIFGEVIPGGEKNTQYVFVGNIVHLDGFMMRLKKLIEQKEIDGVYRSYKLFDENKKIIWSGKYTSWKEIIKLKKRMPEAFFQQEYLLNPIPLGNTIIKAEYIHYYDYPQFPPESLFRNFIISVDSASSQKDTADNTGITVYKVYGYGKDMRIYGLPLYVNKKLTYPQIIEEIQRIITSFGPNPLYQIYVEGAGQQQGLAQILRSYNLNAIEISIGHKDKPLRLAMSSVFMQNMVVLFPKNHLTELINQMLYFGTQRYDDLADSFSLMCLNILELEKVSKLCRFTIHMDLYPKLPFAISRDDEDWAVREDREIFDHLRKRRGNS